MGDNSNGDSGGVLARPGGNSSVLQDLNVQNVSAMNTEKEKVAINNLF